MVESSKQNQTEMKSPGNSDTEYFLPAVLGLVTLSWSPRLNNPGWISSSMSRLHCSRSWLLCAPPRNHVPGFRLTVSGWAAQGKAAEHVSTWAAARRKRMSPVQLGLHITRRACKYNMANLAFAWSPAFIHHGNDWPKSPPRRICLLYLTGSWCLRD